WQRFLVSDGLHELLPWDEVQEHMSRRYLLGKYCKLRDIVPVWILLENPRENSYETQRFRASTGLRGGSNPRPDRRQVEGRDPVSSAIGHAALWRAAETDAGDYPAHADQAASCAGAGPADYPKGLCRSAAARGILPVRHRRESQTRDRYAKGLGRAPSGPAILRAHHKSAATGSVVTPLPTPPSRAYLRPRILGICHMKLIRSLSVLLIAAGVAMPALAQDRKVPSSQAELMLSYAPIVQRVQPAVVNVYAAKVVQNHNPFMDDPIFRRFFGLQGGPKEQMQRSLGSGVMVDPSGLVVTNVHVIEGADQVKVSLSDKREFEAEIVLKDPRSDLAVLRLKNVHEKFPTLDFANSDQLMVGDVVLAIGNPFGVGQTVTHGIISALARTQVGISDYQFFIQTDAPINPGNSGGALVDMNGRLAGINTAIFSRSGGSQGIGFAIPSNMVRVVVASAKSGRKEVKRPWLGANLQAVTAEISETMGLKLSNGALVSSVVQNLTAAQAGLKDTQLVVARDGKTTKDPNAIDYRFATHPIGGTAEN